MKDDAGIKSGWIAVSAFVGAALFVAALLWLAFNGDSNPRHIVR